MERIAVIDYGMGNLRSVSKALEHVASAHQQVLVTSEASVVESADRIVFPGQGAIRGCMSELARSGLRPVIERVVYTRPFLGICMGLQALMDRSEEDPDTEGLGTISGSVRRFAADLDADKATQLKIPHMGWNNVHRKIAHPLWQDIDDDTRFYFVHSYYVDPHDTTLVAATCTYGVEFACALAHENLFAVQFHPEKSQHAGLTLLSNFLTWSPG